MEVGLGKRLNGHSFNRGTLEVKVQFSKAIKDGALPARGGQSEDPPLYQNHALHFTYRQEETGADWEPYFNLNHEHYNRTRVKGDLGRMHR